MIDLETEQINSNTVVLMKSSYQNLYADFEGNVYRRTRSGMRRVSQLINNAGYAIVNATNNSGKHTTVTAQRIVATAWLPNPQHLSDVDHKNGDKLDNSVNNLQWLSHRANLARRHTFSRQHRVLKVADGQVVASYHSISAAARDNHLSFSSVRGSANHQLALDRDYYFEFAQSDKQEEA